MPEEGRATDSIFISYRRDDSAPYAGRLCDHLTEAFGASRVFMDVEDIEPGSNFADAIDHTIGQCQAVLVVIGPRWFEILQQRASQSQPDYVVHEVGAALKRKTRVIPVLVGGAKPEELNNLPASIAELALREAVELRDSSFKDDCGRLQKALGSRTQWRLWAALLAGAAVLVLGLLLWLRPGPRQPKANAPSADPRIVQLMATARTQTSLGAHERAFRTYEEVLKLAPTDPAALDGEVDAAMRWAENFRVTISEGQRPEDVAGPPISTILNALEAGLARAGEAGPRAATILAHIGWARWLNRHIAAKEFGPEAEQALRRALEIDPSNVFANAMLGNWLLQNGGSVEKALARFDAAVRTGQERPLVRAMQLGVLTDSLQPGITAAAVRLANQMRAGGESMTARLKRRILQNFNATMYGEAQLEEALTAVPPADGWATFEWLDEDHSQRPEVREYIHARYLEGQGDRQRALGILKALQEENRKQGNQGRLADSVNAAVNRLSR